MATNKREKKAVLKIGMHNPSRFKKIMMFKILSYSCQTAGVTMK